MRTIRTIIGSILVYLCVAMVQACGSAGTHGSGGGHGVGGAGGSVVANANADESGSRIEVVYQIGDDGSKIQARYYDKSRKEYCETYQASDGRIHCMPSIGTMLGTSSLGVVFSDPGCSVVLAQRMSCYPPPKYVIAPIGTYTCSSYYSVYAAGPAVASTVPIYVGAPGACSSASQQQVGVSYYSAGAEIQPSAFVGFTPQTP